MIKNEKDKRDDKIEENEFESSVDLPNEIWEVIGDFCDSETIISLMLAKKSIFQIFRHREQFWRRKCKEHFGYSRSEYCYEERIIGSYYQLYQWFLRQIKIQPLLIELHTPTLSHHESINSPFYKIKRFFFGEKENSLNICTDKEKIDKIYTEYKCRGQEYTKDNRNSHYFYNWPERLTTYHQFEAFINKVYLKYNYKFNIRYKNKVIMYSHPLDEIYQKRYENVLDLCFHLPLVPGIDRLLAYTDHPLPKSFESLCQNTIFTCVSWPSFPLPLREHEFLQPNSFQSNNIDENEDDWISFNNYAYHLNFCREIKRKYERNSKFEELNFGFTKEEEIAIFRIIGEVILMLCETLSSILSYCEILNTPLPFVAFNPNLLYINKKYKVMHISKVGIEFKCDCFDYICSHASSIFPINYLYDVFDLPSQFDVKNFYLSRKISPYIIGMTLILLLTGSTPYPADYQHILKCMQKIEIEDLIDSFNDDRLVYLFNDSEELRELIHLWKRCILPPCESRFSLEEIAQFVESFLVNLKSKYNHFSDDIIYTNSKNKSDIFNDNVNENNSNQTSADEDDYLDDILIE